jgi:hypothetical protein
MIHNGPPAAIIRAVIRGESDTSELASAGLEISENDSGYTIVESSELPVVEPSIQDVALGLYSNWARSSEFSSWARFVLGANSVDLRELEDREHGQAILEMLWRASAGNVLTTDDVKLLEDLIDASP